MFHGKGNETMDVTEVATHFEIDWGGRLAELLGLYLDCQHHIL